MLSVILWITRNIIPHRGVKGKELCAAAGGRTEPPMKKTLITIAGFAVLLFALLGAARLLERARPEESAAAPDEPAQEETALWEQTPDAGSATVIRLGGDYVTVRGAGAVVSAGNVVTIAYPGVYSVTGLLSDGCIVVDCELEGTVSLILDNAHISCSTGPAIYIRDTAGTLVYLADGTQNSLSDGTVYEPVTGADGLPEAKQPDAVLYSADDLALAGGGTLTIRAGYDSAVHSRDRLTIAGGELTVESAGDGVRAADGVTMLGGTLALRCTDDGVASSKKDVRIRDGALTVFCGGDAISAGREVEISGGSVTVNSSREGLEAPVISLSGGSVSVTAADNALVASMGDVDSGVTAADCFVRVSGGTLYTLAPCCVRSDGGFELTDGTVFLRSSENGKPVRALWSTVSGGTLFLCGDFETEGLTFDGGVNAVYWRAGSVVEAGETVSLADETGEAFFALTPNTEFSAVLIAYGGLVRGGSYTLSCGSQTASFTQNDALSTAEAVRGWGGFGGPSGGPGGGPRP